MQYLVIYERTERNWGAYSPDVPGCVATAKTRLAVQKRFAEASRFHLEGLRLGGLPMPTATSEAELIEIAAIGSTP